MATQQKPNRPSPEGCGWNKKNGVVQLKHFEWPTAAEMLEDLVRSCRGIEPCRNKCTCMQNTLYCTEECLCASTDRDCCNDLNQNIESES